MNRRTQLLSLALVLAIGGAAVASAKKASHSGNALPKLEIQSLEHSFGRVVQGTPLTCTFQVKNAGHADLKILGVKPSCGCTRGDFDSLVTAGKEGKITLTIAHTENYKTPIVKTANVTTNDPEHASLTLTLRADFFPKEPLATGPAPVVPPSPAAGALSAVQQTPPSSAATPPSAGTSPSTRTAPSAVTNSTSATTPPAGSVPAGKTPPNANGSAVRP